MDPKPQWRFEKGNIDMTVTKSGAPIPKEKIDGTILNFLYENFPNDSRLLTSSNFTLEFIGVEKTAVFVKVNVEGINKKSLEIKLIGDNAKRFVDLIHGTLQPPHSAN